MADDKIIQFKPLVGLRLGIFDKKHYDAMGNALWEFAWCVDRTTQEVEKDGVTWGVVLGGRVITNQEIADSYGGRKNTVRDHMDQLEAAGYIKRERKTHGAVIFVKNSQKNVEYRNAKRKAKRAMEKLKEKW